MGISDVDLHSVYNCMAKVYRSLDVGASFQTLVTGIPGINVNRISIGVTPADPEVVYALASRCSDGGFEGLYRSTDHGTTWVKTPYSNNLNLLGWQPNGLDPDGQGWFTLSLSVDPSDANHVFVGGVNIWESSDGGDIRTLNAQYYGSGAEYVHADIHTLAYNPLNDVHYNTNDGGIYRYDGSPDGWVNISDGLHIMQFYRLGACDNFFDYNQPDTCYYGGYAAGIRRSINGGQTWVNISMNLPNMPANCLAFEPGSDNAIYAGTDVGVFYTNDNLTGWVDYSEALPSVIIDELEVHPVSGKILAATYERGMWETTWVIR